MNILHNAHNFYCSFIKCISICHYSVNTESDISTCVLLFPTVTPLAILDECYG